MEGGAPSPIEGRAAYPIRVLEEEVHERKQAILEGRVEDRIQEGGEGEVKKVSVIRYFRIMRRLLWLKHHTPRNNVILTEITA
jgi:hypothetical protein